MNRQSETTPRDSLFVLALLVAGSMFAFDLTTEFGVAAGVPYIFAICLAFATRKSSFVIVISCLCMLLTIAGYFLSPAGGEFWEVLFNRCLATLAILITAVLCIQVLSLLRRVKLNLQLVTSELTEEKLHAEESQQIIEATPSGMMLVRHDGQIAQVNAATCKIFGYKAGELVGEPVEKLVPEQFRLDYPHLRDEYFRSPKPRSISAAQNLYVLHKDGRHVPVEIGLNPMVTAEGLYVLASIVDNTAHKRYEDELRAAAEQLRAANEDLESFTRIASHDLQEPLRNVLSYTSQLKIDVGEDLTEDAAEDLEFIMSATKRMQRLLDDLLAFSKAGRHDVNTQRVALDDCLDEAILVLDTRIRDSFTTIQRTPLPHASVDATLVTELFQNLIGNAIKFTTNPQPVIEITAHEDGGWVFGVKDNGIGIQKEYAEQIFSPFKRLHGMTEYEGSGIGLAICRKVVTHHGGKIWVESEPGSGSHFKFTLQAA